MEVPNFLENIASEAVQLEADTARKRNLWAVILGLTPARDGNMWVVLWGENLQEGVAAFGKSPFEAMMNFEKEMESEIR